MSDTPPATPPTFTYCPDPVFVFGAPRSGTTALARALGMHGDFYVGDETFFLWELYGQGRAEKVFEQWATRPSSSWLRRERVSRDEFLAALGLGLNALMTRSSGARRWIDHTPHHCLMADTLAGMFPGARFLHVLRDGREVVNSMIHIAATVPAAELDDMKRRGFLPPWGHDFRAACTTWRDSARAAAEFCARQPARALTVIHGDLERNPEATLVAVLRFLDAPLEAGPAAFLRRDRINSSFTRPGGVPAAEYRRPDPWSGWSAEQRATFTDIAGADLCRHGFAAPGDLSPGATCAIGKN
ncbi:MAG: sulfotransferase family protein [Planctomycetaceae bacterium]